MKLDSDKIIRDYNYAYAEFYKKYPLLIKYENKKFIIKTDFSIGFYDSARIKQWTNYLKGMIWMRDGIKI